MTINKETQINICKGYKAGKSCLKLAKQYNCHYQTILRILRKYNIPRRSASENTFKLWKKKLIKGRRRNPPIENFRKHYVVLNNGCWQWVGTKRGSYGQFNINIKGVSKHIPAHQFSWIHHKGPILKGLVLDHLCRNRLCVNPNHLEPVTLKDNILRGRGHAAKNARKTHCSKGHPLSGHNLRIYKRTYANYITTYRSCRTCNNRRQAECQKRKRNK